MVYFSALDKKKKDELTNISKTDETIGVIAGPNQPFTDAKGRIGVHHNTVFLVKDIRTG